MQACAFLAVAMLELVWPHAVSSLLGYTKELAVRRVGPHLSNKQHGHGAPKVVSIVAAANKASQQRVVVHQRLLSCLQRAHKDPHSD